MAPPHDGAATDHLAALGWDTGWAAAFDRLPGVPARVARVDRGALRAITADGPVSAVPPLDRQVVTGDWVAVRDREGTGPVVTACAVRRTALVRRDPAAEPGPQTLAANMDQVWVVHAADRPLRPAWLDRALVVAYGSDATPLLVLAKADLARDAAAAVDAARRMAPHTEVLATSTASDAGLDTLAERLRAGGCAALLGRSGAGKSSLVNALAGTTREQIGAVRAADARGRHTTARRALVPVAGGSVIDTPGIRAIGLWDAGVGLQRTFPDIADLAGGCRFGDCSHQHEPECAVRDAHARGDLDDHRYRRFVTLWDEHINTA